MDLINKKKYTRYPVYEDNVDIIVGIFNAKDLIQFLEEKNQEFDRKDHPPAVFRSGVEKD